MLQGYCDPRYRSVREAFARNFTEHGERGASICVIAQGETVVHLWGGESGGESVNDSGRPWNEDTVCHVFSCTKGAVALCAHLLADAGELDFERPIRDYWPEFGQNGKAEIPLRMALNHQAGLPAIRTEFGTDELFDGRALARLIERDAPVWEPGTSHGYHAVSFGVLIDEVIHRVTGRSAGRFFRDEVAGPLGLDYWIGLPESVEPRLAPIVLPDIPAATDPRQPVSASDTVAAVRRNVEVLLAACRDREFRAAGNPAGGGVATAAGLAGMYAPLSLDGTIHGKRLISENAIPSMARPRSVSDRDAVLDIPTAFTLGFTSSWGTGTHRPGLGFCLGESAFGHPGMGGSIGFADPANHLAFGYVMTRMNGLPSLDERAQSLIDATYRAAGLRDRKPGFWRH
ncbi:serine hydrolase domain-containing protein [Elongatibacter sediminis]|uniref:Serine hydrolase domain-containing protein n=1 Tax=Elongatibacter sediminis TaxID=3119006 RepID=A0AAW9RCW3_9GAMM